MAGRIPGALVGAAFVALVFAGCVGEADPIAPFLVDGVRGFTATVESTTGGTSNVTLEGPVDLRVADGRSMSAYRLASVSPGNGRIISFVSYLDRDFRTIAYQFCQHADECDWSWVPGFWLPPMGIGIPDLIERGDLVVYRGSQAVPVEWEVVPSTTGRLALELRAPDFFNETDVERYAYTKGRLLPDSESKIVTHYEEGARLALADRLVFPPALPQPSEWSALMFPGEDEEAFGLGMTHAELVLRAYPQAAEDPDACVVYYRWRSSTPHPTPMILGLVPFPQSEEHVGSLHLEVAIAGVTKGQAFNVYRDGEGKLRFESSPVGSLPDLGCATVQRSPAPSTSFAEGLEYARSLVEGADLREFTYNAIGRKHYIPEPEAGWHTFTFSFDAPEQVHGWEKVAVQFQPTPERELWRAIAPPGHEFVLDS